MRTAIRTFVAVILCFSAATIGLRSSQPPPEPASHVVIISLDGFPASALDVGDLPIPNLRGLAARGAVAQGMRPVNPTVTWPNHTTIVTGVTPATHGVLFNGMLMREPGVPPRVEPWRDKDEMVRAPTLYDLAHERGMTTAQVDWVAIWNAPTITWEFRERPDPQGVIAREMIAEGVVREADVQAFASKHIAYRDHVWTTAAAHIVKRHKPNLLLFHLLNLDSTHHRYGPRTHAARTAMAQLDSQVGTIVRAIDEAGTASRTTLFIVSDHGFRFVNRQIRPNVALERAGLLKTADGKVTTAQAFVVSEGGTAIVYLTGAEPSIDETTLERAREALRGVEGIDRVIEQEDFAALGLPVPEDNLQMGVLLLTAKDGYGFSAAVGSDVVVETTEGSFGSHGYLADDPELQSLFIASGRGVKPGIVLDRVNAIDVAPTAARLLGFEMEDVDGRVLTEILTNGELALVARQLPVRDR